MIDYQTFHQIRQLCDQEHLSVTQIAAALQLDERTVGKWIECQTYQPRAQAKRASKLDPHKGAIVRLLATHPFTAQQLLQRLRESGYTGGYSILKEYVRAVRPPRQPGFPEAPLCSGAMRPSGLGLGRVPAGGQHATAALLSLSWCSATAGGLYVEFTLAQTPGTLPGLPPARL